MHCILVWDHRSLFVHKRISIYSYCEDSLTNKGLSNSCKQHAGCHLLYENHHPQHPRIKSSSPYTDMGSGRILQTEISWAKMGIKARISNYIQVKQWDVITHLWPNFHDGLTKPPLKLWHGWVITSQRRKAWLQLLFHVNIPVDLC